MSERRNDDFELYDLRVEVEEIRGTCTCDHAIGESFDLRGGKIGLPPGQSFCLYALQATIPLLPAKQRGTRANDWMTTDTRVVCPDPLCGLVMRIDRIGRRTLRHSDVSAVSLNSEGEANTSTSEDANPNLDPPAIHV